ncbi:MAG: hypothetical protein ACYC0Y_19950 [Pirellulales bacterium]
MRLLSILGAMCLSAAAAVFAAAPLPPSGALPEVLPWRQNRFSIPFRIERPQQASQEPAEVHLYVSDDRGVTWRLYDKVDPKAGSFVFQAPRDGEYWFLVRTVDRFGKIRPEGSRSPELRVAIDTVPPRLQLRAGRGEAGEVSAQWQITEPNLKPESFKLAYQVVGSGTWQAVAANPPRADASGKVFGGEVTWVLPPGPTAIVVRAEAADRAGNPAVAQTQVNLDRSASANRPGALVPIGNRSETVADRRGSNAMAWPPDSSAARPPSPDPKAAQPTPPPAMDDRFPAAETGPQLSRTPDDRETSKPSPEAAQSPVFPAIENRVDTTRPPTATADANILPPGERPSMVNSRRFELEYDVESIGPAGIGKVELWGTTDGGTTWKSYAVDDDNRSPILVAVDGEGVYGFRVVVQSSAGLGGAPPKSGDAPEVWIGVDLTKPAAKFISAEQGEGEQGGELLIRWEASDLRPAARPISLAFSDKPSGPWTTIAAGLENTGQYTWRLDNRVPEQVYLRLEVRDEAGNVTVVENPKPISLNRLHPKGHIRNVRPVGSTALGPKRYHFF